MNFDWSSENSWESIAVLGGIIVVVGIALEIADLVFKWKKEHRHVTILASDPRWVFWIESASVVLVILGLVVEIFATYKVTLIARKTSDELRTSAQEAYDKARAAEKNAGEAIKQAAVLNVARVELAKQVEEQRADNLALLQEITFTVSPWELGIERPNPELQAFSNMTAFVSSFPNQESAKFASDIATTIGFAGWQVQRAQSDFEQPFRSGIEVQVNKFAFLRAHGQPMPDTNETQRLYDLEVRATKASESLVPYLNSKGPNKARALSASSKIPPGAVLILVGPKPNTFAERMSEARIEAFLKKMTNAVPPK